MREVNNEENVTMDRNKYNVSRNGAIVTGSTCKLPVKRMQEQQPLCGNRGKKDVKSPAHIIPV